MTAKSNASADGNCVMLLTPPGVGAIAVVRICGDRVDGFLQNHFTKFTQVGRATHGNLIDNDRVLDDPLIARLSFEMADINLHGGTWLVQSVIDLAARAGFTYLETHSVLPFQAVDGAGELQIEMSIALPAARTEEGIRLLLAQPQAWMRLLQDPIDKHEAWRALQDRSLHWLLNPPTVAIVGPANVGKSSLANQLFGRVRSITADIPGTTRDWVGDVANIDGLPVILIDTPGIRETKDLLEAEAIARAASKIEKADLVLLVSEAGRQDAVPLQSHQNRMKVNNKLDRGRGDGVNTNAITGEGIDELRAAICAHFGLQPMNLTNACCWTQRQRKVLENLLA